MTPVRIEPAALWSRVKARAWIIHKPLRLPSYPYMIFLQMQIHLLRYHMIRKNEIDGHTDGWRINLLPCLVLQLTSLRTSYPKTNDLCKLFSYQVINFCQDNLEHFRWYATNLVLIPPDYTHQATFKSAIVAFLGHRLTCIYISTYKIDIISVLTFWET